VNAPVMSFEWFGTNPQKGLAVLSYGDYAFELHPSYDRRHRWIVPVSVSGPISFLLFAVWTVARWNQSLKHSLNAFAFFSRRQDREPLGAISRGLLDCPRRV
jgi:hypothetical protein